MKKLIFMLLLTSGVYAQQQVFNVQRYCIDEKPFKKGSCDSVGNEYSFVFLDEKKKKVVFFLTDLKFEYQITGFKKDANNIYYTLANNTSIVEMKISNGKRNIEFNGPDRRVFLTVGRSTKL
ncbi:MAG: hypothetical protein H7221_09890 [Flavobacterium sp.]|nr:hypothetical protein [Flavobacterium sp.]